MKWDYRSARRKRIVGVGLAASLLAGSVVAPASRADHESGIFVVNTTDDAGDLDLNDHLCQTDGGDCTLRAAIEQANADGTFTFITFGISGTITVSPDLPTITQPVSIDATGSSVVLAAGESAATGLHITAGTSTVLGLTITGFSTAGIHLDGPGGPDVGNLVQGNTIGPGNGIGIDIATSDDNRIGGSEPGEANVITGNTGDGIRNSDGAGGNTIARNSIFDNGGLGINHTGEVPPNTPVITGASASSVTGTYTDDMGSYRIEVFGNTTCDSSGSGEGEQFLGFTDVEIVDSFGTVPFTVTPSPAPSAGTVITATATALVQGDGPGLVPGQTSPFSTCFVTPAPPPPPSGGGSGSGGSSSGSSTPSRRGSDSSSCSSGDACTVRVVTSDEVFDITAEKGRSAKLKAKIDGGDSPKCQGSKDASRHWVQFWFAKGGSDRAKTIKIYVTDLDDNQKYNWFVNRQNVCYGAPYEFEAKDGYSLTRDRKGEFIGMLPDCRQLHPGFDNNSWWAKRIDGPCVAERELTRKWDERVVRITVVVPPNELDPRVRRDV